VENIRKHPEKLRPGQRKELQRIGFDFQQDTTWDDMFYQLEAYFEKHGHSYVPPDQKEFEKLFDWTVNQRNAKTLLTKKQIEKLNSLRFDWEMLSYKDFQWERRYHELVSFKRKYGHTRVPYKFKANVELAGWVAHQRKNKTEEKLTPERIKRLNELGFLWKEDIEKMRLDAWDKRYEELVRYKKEKGHIDRLQIIKDHYQLGLWVDTQMVRQKKKMMEPHRKKKLDVIGFVWDKGNFREERWDTMHQKLIAYKKKHGHIRVKRREDFKLSVWLQRQKRDRYKLPADKRNKLERLGIKWSKVLFKEIWESRYNELKAFKKKHGHLNVPRADKSMYEWIQFQKELKEENKLSKERLAKLEKLDFVWKGEVEKQKMAAWESMFKKFQALKEKYGPKYYLKVKENPGLDRWVHLQSHSRDKLSAYKKEKLNAMGFPWDRTRFLRELHWEKMYERLKAFKDKFGHCDVSQRYADKQLAQWINGQRTRQISPKARKLSRDQIVKLNKLGFSWANEVDEKRWMQRVKEFKVLKKKNIVPNLRDHSQLYAWMYQQRKNFHKLPDVKKKILVREGIIKVDKSVSGK
jgi:hypothetical protein